MFFCIILYTFIPNPHWNSNVVLVGHAGHDISIEVHFTARSFWQSHELDSELEEVKKKSHFKQVHVWVNLPAVGKMLIEQHSLIM